MRYITQKSSSDISSVVYIRSFRTMMIQYHSIDHFCLSVDRHQKITGRVCRCVPKWSREIVPYIPIHHRNFKLYPEFMFHQKNVSEKPWISYQQNGIRIFVRYDFSNDIRVTISRVAIYLTISIRYTCLSVYLFAQVNDFAVVGALS